MKKPIKPLTSQKKVEKTGSQQFELPAVLSQFVISELNKSKSTPSRLAEAIQKQSNFYLESPDAATPWKESWSRIAQIAYYLPLNWMRAAAVVREAERVGFFRGLRSFTDWGSGLGPLSFELAKKVPRGECVELSSYARELHRSWFTHSSDLKDADLSFTSRLSEKAPDLFACSYSLTEIENLPREAFKSEAIMIIEPSTRDDGRRLLILREKLIAEGFSIWAPCLHQGKCPLLHLSQRDWCHDRIPTSLPVWLIEAESHLPFKNRTLTFSYLLARRSSPPTWNQNTFRVTGDLLNEKGKSRQLVCRNEKREFLSWLHKFAGEPKEEIPRGCLIEIESELETKSDELRFQSKDAVVKTIG